MAAKSMSPSTALVPVDEAKQEAYVKEKFWGKMKRTFAKVPFALEAVALFYAATDPATPKKAKAIALAALAYFILPMDAIPDILLGVGWTDDAAIILGAVKTLAGHVTDEHKAKAKAWAYSFRSKAEVSTK
ncbi:hypothetical protein J31TS4_41830 [Paenibacillus sp. J31TS4]|uniref:YkvA family protein n=1 Tax=Paenibacillus sp. J31TS4 TaxID=2807195 RepID=UPI001B2EE508|nr:YkvA family protein [Paenibacillus sp. J31TS4]GIP40903.1 hypothetical protein J31TS4_41830 [Paenibacillus sp. J31TS4]